jgi:hypothetical protein
MFEWDEKNMKKTLGAMFTECRQAANFNHDEAKQRLGQCLARDRRFDGYQHSRLIERVDECMQGGGYLDLTDPYLMGGSKRPGSR